MSAKNGKPTIVFVHGAFCDASIWTKTLMPIAHEGYGIKGAHLPLTSFADDLAALQLMLDHIEGPVLLVGHSYAGAVITAAGNDSKVKALAYVCAFAPDAGEVFGSLMQMNPAEEQMTIQPDAHGFLWMTADWAAKALGHDLHRGYINLACALQKPTSASIFGGTLPGEPAWKSKPSSYLITTEDHILAPTTQRTLAERIGARVEEVPASHFVLLSQSEAVTEFVRRSADAITE